MVKKTLSLLVASAMALALIVAIPGASAQGDLGSADNPIEVFFVPSVEAQTIVEGGEVLAAALLEITGLHFDVSVPTSYAATIEGICAAPANSMGFIPALAYVRGNDICGIEVAAAAVRFGWPAYWAQYIVRRDAPIYVLGDLEGKTWAYGDPASTSGYIVPAVELATMGVTPGEELQTGGHNQTVLAVYNGEADFGTTFYSPPRLPGAQWRAGDLPEPFDLTVDEAYVDEENHLMVGDVRIMDARERVVETAPDVMDQVRILAISAPIPNDALAFGPTFPEDIKQQILDALFELAGDQAAWEQTALFTAYSWNGLDLIADEAYDPIRDQIAVLGMTDDEIFGG